MFGRKKMYKQGLAHAMQAYEGFAEKQKAALDRLRQEVRAGNMQLEEALSGLGEDINGIYDYLTSKEKAALYQLSTPLDLKELEDEERRLLLAVLYQLADDEGSSVTDAQRAYIRSVQKYLEITNPQINIDLSVVGNIDSLEIQKVFLQVALEFFYLQDQDEITDEQEDFLGNFSVNRKQAELIENQVSRLYNVVGAEGLAEKYGYVPLEEFENAKDTDRNVSVQQHRESGCSIKDNFFETESYIFVNDEGTAEFTHMDTGTTSEVDCGVQEAFKYEATPDTVLIHTIFNTVELIYLKENRRQKILTNTPPKLSILATANHYFVYAVPFFDNEARYNIYLADVDTQIVKKAPIPFGTVAYLPMAAMSHSFLCLWAGDPSLNENQNIVLNLMVYKNDFVPIKQFPFYTGDFDCLFGASGEVVSWHTPNCLLIREREIIIIFKRKLHNYGSLYSWKALSIDTSSKSSAPIINEYNFGQTIPPDQYQLSSLGLDGKLFSLLLNNSQDDDCGLFYLDLNTWQETVLVPKGIDRTQPIFRIRDCVGFSSVDQQECLVNINRPGIIEPIIL